MINRVIRFNIRKNLLSIYASDVHERLKTNGTAIKISKETISNQKEENNSVKHIQRQQFSFTKTSIKVFMKILV